MEENNLNNGSEEFQPEEIPEVQSGAEPAEMHKTVHLSGMYENWFLDYASYVILEGLFRK